MRIIRDRAIVEDDFVHVAGADQLPETGKPIVTLAHYVKDREALLGRYSALGVQVTCDKLPSDILDLERLALIAIEFPRFTEGRGYSIATQLRKRHNFRGELRAVGWVLRDHLFFMERCGFNAYELKEGKSLDHVLEAFKEFSVTYQSAADDPRPLYRRR